MSPKTKKILLYTLRNLPKLFPAFSWRMNVLPWALLALSCLGAWTVWAVGTVLALGSVLPVLLAGITFVLLLFVSYTLLKVAGMSCVTYIRPAKKSKPPAGVVYIGGDCQNCCELLGCLACFFLGCGCAMC